MDERTFHDTIAARPFTWVGVPWLVSGAKTFTGVGGTTDQQLQAAVNAAGDFLDASESNQSMIIQQSKDAILANKTYLQHAAIPAGTLTAAQLSGIVRQLSDQLDATTRQLNKLIRLLVGQLDGTD